MLDYPTYYQLTSAFESTSGSIQNLVDVIQSAQSTYSTKLFQVATFLENQDNPRFQSITTDQGVGSPCNRREGHRLMCGCF